MTTPSALLLACPHCGGTNLHSDEAASIMYPVRMVRDAAGVIGPEYTGDGYEVMDEGTEYRGDIWCRACGSQLREADLVEVGPRFDIGAQAAREATL